MKSWHTQFSNDPRRDFDLYMELLEEGDPRGQLERGSDGELYLSLFACPEVKVPFRWLVSLLAQAETLPLPGHEEQQHPSED